jgi:hypothetical protein
MSSTRSCNIKKISKEDREILEDNASDFSSFYNMTGKDQITIRKALTNLEAKIPLTPRQKKLIQMEYSYLKKDYIFHCDK